EEGWGRLKATAEIGKSVWKTAIWFDTKHQTYILPLKAEIRKKRRDRTGQKHQNNYMDLLKNRTVNRMLIKAGY
ncbi:MAG: DUF1905 domain-containing protein, partial [Bacteroidales bacterium]|nr:DUF1905 domain-containing protein [Bacteroidales bacterium]